MGLFGGSRKVTTTVTPAKNVENLLRSIVDQTNNMDVGNYIAQQYAGLNPDEQSALTRLSQNGGLQQALQTYQPLTEKGLGQLEATNEQLSNMAKGGVNIGDILNARDQGLNSQVAQQALKQGTAATGALGGALGGNAALRRQSAQNAQNISAITNNQRGQELAGQAIQNEFANRQAQLGNLGLQTGIGQTNLGLGQNVAQLAQQSANNQLMAGQIQQQNQQAQNQMDWQNALGANQFNWNQLNNKLNILNNVSPMAGYTTTGTSPGISKSQQMLGAATTGLGMFGKMGGFQGFGAQNPQGQYLNQFYNNGGTGAFNGLGTSIGNGLSSIGGSLSGLFS